MDDYGHHPTEIAATLQTARSLQPNRLVVYFQPHRYTRTQMLADDFGKVLQAADLVFVADVYPASELPIEGVSGQTIIDAMHRHGPVETHYLPDLGTAHHAIGNALKPGDLFLTLGPETSTNAACASRATWLCWRIWNAPRANPWKASCTNPCHATPP